MSNGPKNSVCAVIVSFRPRREDLGNLARVRPQVEHLVVVDNGSPEEQLHLLRAASHELDFALIENGQNLGIAAALNVGVKWAQANGSGLGGPLRSGQCSDRWLHRADACGF